MSRNISFWKKFNHFLLIGLSSMVLLVGAQQGLFGGFSGQVLAETGQPVPPQVCTETPAEYPQCGGTCNGTTFPSDHTVFVVKSVDSSCNVSWNCTDQGVKPGECGNPTEQPAPAPAAPAAPTPECNASPSCLGICHDQNTGLVCGPSGGIIGSCTFTSLSGGGNCTPTAAPAQGCSLAACAAPAAPASAAPAVCNQTTNTENRCVGQQLCTFNVTRDCNNSVISESAPSNCQNAAQCGFTNPAAPSMVTNNCGPGTTQSIGQNGAIVCTGNQTNTQGNQTQTTGSVTAQGGSATTGSVTINNPTPAVTVVAARGSVGVGATVGQVLGVKELPKTGLPILAWSALAFIPLGSRMRRFSKIKGELENSPSYIWEARQFKAES